MLRAVRKEELPGKTSREGKEPEGRKERDTVKGCDYEVALIGKSSVNAPLAATGPSLLKEPGSRTLVRVSH